MGDAAEETEAGEEAKAGLSKAAQAANDEIRAYEEAAALEQARQERDQHLLKITQKVYNKLYKRFPYEVNAEISRANRKRLGFQNEVTLSYSQATYPELIKQLARLTRLGLEESFEGHFVDLGSGTGTMMFAAALYHDFSSVTGIEILGDLLDVTNEVVRGWDIVKEKLSHKKQDMRLQTLLGDCCHTDWSHADVVWCNATCFDAGIVEMIAKRSVDLKPGSFFVMCTKSLPAEALLFYDAVDTGSVMYNGGEASVTYYKRNRIPPPKYIANKTDYVNSIIRRKALPVFDPRKAKPLAPEEERTVTGA